MNSCNDLHEPMYKIKYKPTKLNGIMSEWMVCEKCFGREEFFGQAEEIESITSLRNYQEIQLKIGRLNMMTTTVTKKIKKTLLTN